jgi:cellulose synthase/poly-beta-1,6-N-acetylglucosamine synthase-like glycosyltransferase
MIDILPVFVISFVGIFLNVWFFLTTSEKAPKRACSAVLKKFPKVSILIPAHNEAASIADTIKSALKLDYPKNKMEIIVVDNASTDNTAAVARKFPVKVFKIKEKGKSFALEKGFKESSGEFVGILDADTTASPNCLRKMLVHFDDPKIGAVTNMIRVDGEKNLLSIFQSIEYIVSGLVKKILSMIDSLYITPGTLSIFRREVLQTVGFSNDTLTEDMDLALSMLKKDYKIYHCLDAEVRTIIPKGFKEWGLQRIRWYRGYMENMIKHRDIIFNSRHMMLGYFVLPITGLMSVSIGVYATIFMAAEYIKSLATAIYGFSYISPIEQLTIALQNINITDLIYNPYALMLFVFVFFTSLAVIVFAMRIVKGASAKNFLLLPLYMLIYYTMIMLYWVVSVVYEIFRRNKKW